MERKANIKKWIFFILFILLNGLNCFLCTTSFFNNNLSPFPLNGIMIFIVVNICYVLLYLIQYYVLPYVFLFIILA